MYALYSVRVREMTGELHFGALWSGSCSRTSPLSCRARGDPEQHKPRPTGAFGQLTHGTCGPGFRMPTELTPPPPPPDASSTPPPPPPHSSSTNDEIAIDVDDDVRMKRVPSSDDPLNLQLVGKPVQLCRSLSLSDELPWVQVAQKYSITARPPDQRRRWRCTRKLKAFKQGFLNLLACIVVASQTVCNTEAVLGCLITVASVLGYWCWGRHLAARMNWSIVSLAVVFPITQGIGMGFRRREEALRDLSQLLGCTRSVWEAVHTWRIKNQQGEWVRCVEAYEVRQRRELQQLFHSFLAALITYFDCVRGGRARHTVGWSLEEQAAVFCTCSSPPPPPPPPPITSITSITSTVIIHHPAGRPLLHAPRAARHRRQPHLADAPPHSGRQDQRLAWGRGAPHRQLRQHDGHGV